MVNPDSECVSKWIKELKREHPDWKQDQVVAVAYAKCRKGDSAITGDAILLPNQPVAKEGVLQYPDGPKAKKWEDLAMNIGRIVPVLDGHPRENNGNHGLFSGKEKIHGYAFIKGTNDRKQLLADIYLTSKIDRSGYSIGYPYIPVEEHGDIDGEKYDEVQSKLVIDHVALTSIPRDDQAMKGLYDSREVGGEDPVAMHHHFIPRTGSDDSARVPVITTVHIKRVGHDAHAFSRDPGASDARTLDDVISMLRAVNPDTDDDEILMHARSIVRNETRSDRKMAAKSNTPEIVRDGDEISSDMEDKEKKKMEEEEEEEDMKKKSDSIDSELQRLRDENSILREKVSSITKDSVEDQRDLELQMLKSRVAAMDSELEKIRAQENQRIKRSRDEYIQTVMKLMGADSDTIHVAMDARGAQDMHSFIAGMEFMRQNLVMTGPEHGLPVSSDAISSPSLQPTTAMAVPGASKPSNPSHFGQRWFQGKGWVNQDEWERLEASRKRGDS